MSTNLDELGSNYQRELTQLSYLDISAEGQAWINNPARQEDPNQAITVSELRQYLSEPDHVSYANFGGTTEISQKMSKFISGHEMTTDADILDKLEKYGMGDLKVVAIKDDRETGLQAICFEDESGNRGFSFRGTDFNFEKGAIGGDIIQGDVGEWMTGDSPAAQEAIKFFQEHKNDNGQNHLYGHSLGGNMVSHVFAANHEDVEMAFTFAGLGIHTDNLSQEQLDAFNSEKFNCWIPEGDVIGMLKDYNAYSDRVFFCDVNDDYTRNPVSSHIAQSSDTGQADLKQLSREEAEQLMDRMAGTYAFCTGAHSLVEEFEDKAKDVGQSISDRAKEAGQSISEYAGERMRELREGDYGAFASALLDSTKEWASKAFSMARESLNYAQDHKEEITQGAKDFTQGAKDFLSNPKESIGKAINDVGDYIKERGVQMDKENIASHHPPDVEVHGEKAQKVPSASQRVTTGDSLNNSAATANKDNLTSVNRGDTSVTGKVENFAQNAGSAANQKLGEVSNSISSIDQLFGGDGNTFTLGEMRESLGFAQQAMNFAQDMSRGDFVSMGKDMLNFGQQFESQFGGGSGGVLDDALDIGFGRER